jgi:hypothetical protein
MLFYAKFSSIMFLIPGWSSVLSWMLMQVKHLLVSLCTCRMKGSLEIFAATTVDRRVMAADPSGPSPF